MFAVNIRQDRSYRIAQNIPIVGKKMLSLWLKYTDSGVAGLSVDVCNLSTNYCEARLHFSRRIQQGDYTCGLAQICEWVAAACYSYTHHQRLSQQLARWHMEIHKPIRSDVVAVAKIQYGLTGDHQEQKESKEKLRTQIKVEVLDIDGELVAAATYLLRTNPITR